MAGRGVAGVYRALPELNPVAQNRDIQAANPPEKPVQTLLSRFNAALTPDRVRRYPLMLLALSVAVYLSSAVRAHDWIEPDGQVIGRDYLAFYMAGEMVRSGDAAALYDVGGQQAWQQAFMADINPGWTGTCLYLNPPHYAWLMSWITPLGYGGSLAAWWALCAAAFVATALIWRRWLAADRFRSAVVLTICLPAWFWALAGGQNSFFSLLVLTAFCGLLMRGRDFCAGAVLGLLAFKFQLLLLPAGMLVLKRRWRAMAGLAACGGVTLLATVLLVGPESLAAYIRFGLHLGELLQIEGFDVYKQHSWHGFVALLGHGWMSPLAVKSLAVCLALASLAPLAVIWRGGWSQQRLPAQLSALCVANLLISPHLFHYDMLLIALPAVLWLAGVRPSAGKTGAGAEAVGCPGPEAMRPVLGLGFVWLAISPGVAGALGVQLSPLIMLGWLVVAARAARAYAGTRETVSMLCPGVCDDRSHAARDPAREGPDRHGARPGPAGHAV